MHKTIVHHIYDKQASYFGSSTGRQISVVEMYTMGERGVSLNTARTSISASHILQYKSNTTCNVGIVLCRLKHWLHQHWA